MSTHFLRNVLVFRVSDGFFSLSDQGEQSGRGPAGCGNRGRHCSDVNKCWNVQGPIAREIFQQRNAQAPSQPSRSDSLG